MVAASGHPIALACQAMGTRFELVIHDEADPARLRSIGEAALEEVRRWHDLLSLFDKASVIARINREAADRPVSVPPEVAQLLRWCLEATNATGGAFNIAVGHLMRDAGFRGTDRPRTSIVRAVLSGAERTEAGSDAPRAASSNSLSGQTEAPVYTITPDNRVALPQGVALDLGAIGKGWALDRATELLGELGITNALLHGGTSSVAAIGGPRRIALDNTTTIDLTNQALGLSAPDGRQITNPSGNARGHILNPRTGESVHSLAAAAVTGPSAAVCDAWSTALIVDPTLAQAPTWPIGYLAYTNTGNGFHQRTQPTPRLVQGTPA